MGHGQPTTKELYIQNFRLYNQALLQKFDL
jgi:hypothetical protein